MRSEIHRDRSHGDYGGLPGLGFSLRESQHDEDDYYQEDHQNDQVRGKTREARSAPLIVQIFIRLIVVIIFRIFRSLSLALFFLDIYNYSFLIPIIYSQILEFEISRVEVYDIIYITLFVKERKNEQRLLYPYL